ncbi:MAG TPA: hypothetical protein VE075_00330, partial [Thermoanaerobaculia bacterium]|nr:hypothetical protein [Thermoanaerobaculia bacterium]
MTIAATLLLLPALLSMTAAAPPPPAGGPGKAPDYAVWNQLLARYYNPDRGMDYGGLKANDGKALADLRQRLGGVDAEALAAPDRLAYWINVYNVNVVATVVDHYPVASI